jgi:hypothetical protein
MHYEHLELSLQLRWQLHFRILYLPIQRICIVLQGLLEVELSLIHQDLEGRELILAEVHRRLRQVLVYRVGEEGDVAHRVVADAVNETCFLSSAFKRGKILKWSLLVEFRDVIDFNVDNISLLVGYSLLKKISEVLNLPS